MKNIKSYLIAIWVLLFLAGCGDAIVDLKPKDKFTTEVALSNLDGIEGAIYGVYERGRNIYESNDVSVYNACQTDIVKAGTNLGDQAALRSIFNIDNTFNGSLQVVKGIWDGFYVGLNRANLIIEMADKVEFEQSAGNIARKNRIIGEALFFRAYYHYYLVTRWDNIVLATQSAVDPNDPIVLVGADKVYPVIYADLIKAAELLPEAAAINSPGRISKGTARHLLAKAYMMQSEWAKAAEVAEQVVNDPAYDLVPIEEGIFDLDNQENKEIIFSWQFSQNDRTHPQRISHQWYPLYDRVSGVARTLAQGGRPWSRLVPSDYYWTLFEPTDKRLDGWHKRTWYFDTNAADDPLPEGASIGDPVTAENVGSASGFGMNAIYPTTDKFKEDSDILGKDIGAAEGFRNIIFYRVSEAYLIAAEANWRAGNMGKGLEFINAVRQRAGVSNFSTIDQNIILDEQARELGHEGHRWEMLKRMGVLVDKVKANNPDAGPNIQSFNVRWPIPRAFVDMTGVDQNEGYSE